MHQMRTTFHLVPAEVWAAIDPTVPYAAPSLATEGFIHTTDGATALLATANRHYRDDPRPFLVLTLDLDATGSPWTFDDAAQIYPHIHGRIDRSAVLRVGPLVRDGDGRFTGFARDPSGAMVQLRPYVDADRWLTEAIETDDAMMAELGGPLPASAIARVHDRRIEGMAADRLWYFVVELEAESKAVGTICLWSDDVDGQPRSEAGWAVLRAFQGQGIASEALRQLLDRADEDGRWGEIHAFPGVSNAASNALCRTAGFRHVGESTVIYAGRDLHCNHWVMSGPTP